MPIVKWRSRVLDSVAYQALVIKSPVMHERPLPPRRALRGHFPNEQAALKCIYLTNPIAGPHRQR